MADGFLSRWSRLKTEAREHPQAAEVAAPGTLQRDSAPRPVIQSHAAQAPAAQGEHRVLPTLEDAAALGPQSDYSAFVARDVDPSVRRLALRKLFSDPHFNIGDGLDIYMGDYTKASPVSPAMLASLAHAGTWLGLGPKENEGEHGVEDNQQQAQRPEAQDGAPDGDTGVQQHQHEAAPPQGAPAREHDEH